MSTARAWREYPQRYRYEAGVCRKCNKWHFPPRLICDACGGREFETRAMRRTGKILTHTVIRVAPSQFVDQSPYAIAIVEMDDGPRITTQIVDHKEAELRIGQRVRLEFRKISADGHAGPIQYGYKAVPV
jgi:scaffold protein (connect acetoacetyl-CoA thiolase and HMG-CoA synthase)